MTYPNPNFGFGFSDPLRITTVDGPAGTGKGIKREYVQTKLQVIQKLYVNNAFSSAFSLYTICHVRLLAKHCSTVSSVSFRSCGTSFQTWVKSYLRFLNKINRCAPTAGRNRTVTSLFLASAHVSKAKFELPRRSLRSFHFCFLLLCTRKWTHCIHYSALV